MPQVTVYVRNDDIEAWRAIKKKAEWLHNALTNHAPTGQMAHIPFIKRPVAPEPRLPVLEVNKKSHTYLSEDDMPH